jgi:hypothetical protein
LDPEFNPLPKNHYPNNDDFIIKRTNDLDTKPEILQIEDDDEITIIPAITNSE